MVVVESPLQSDLSDVNTSSSSSSSSTSTDTNVSSNGNPSSTSNSIPGTSAASIHSSSTPTSTTSGNNDNNANTEATVDGDSKVPSLVSSSSSGGTIGGDNSKTCTTDSTPVGGMQESTYVLSDSAYIPAKPAAAASGTGDVTTNNTILPTFSEDSADYSHSTSNNSSNDNNINTSHNSNDSPSSVAPLARSVVVRVECAVWSKYSYTTESTKSSGINNDTFTTTSKAVPLQDYHYSMANTDSNTASSGKDAEIKGDLQTELVTCIKVYLFSCCFTLFNFASQHCQFRRRLVLLLVLT